MMTTQVDGVRIGPPPDLPSLLLHNRIVYVGTGIVPQVAELIVAQLLYLQVRVRRVPARSASALPLSPPRVRMRLTRVPPRTSCAHLCALRLSACPV
jgi:hypothetical protein